jgi:subtilase family serine protease
MAAIGKTPKVHGRRLLFAGALVAVVATVLVTISSSVTAPTQVALRAGSSSVVGHVVAARGPGTPPGGKASDGKGAGSPGSLSKNPSSASVRESDSTSITKGTAIVAPPAVPTGATKISALPGTTTLTADIVLKPADPSGLEDYAQQVSTPGSPDYRHFLPKGAFASLFGPSPQSISAVESALRSHGLADGRLSADHLTISVRTTADQLARGLATSFSRYRLQGGRIAFANTASPELPADVAGDVQDITGLDNLFQVQSGALRASAAPVPKARSSAIGAPHVVTGGPQPCPAASAASSTGAYTADQIASAYGFSTLYGQGDEGQGQSVAVIEAEPNLASDIAAYQSCYGTDASVNYVSVDGGAGPTGPGSGEAALDIEQIIGLAPKANVVVYQSPATLDNIYDSFSTAITADTSRVISTSWGTCEGFAGNNPEDPDGSSGYFTGLFDAENTLFEQAAAQGQSVVAASGDDGSEGCEPWQTAFAGFSSQLDVQDPSAQPFVTGVGGTTLADPSAPNSETVWNSYHAGGGGISAQWAMPAYQADAAAAVGVINADSSGTPCLATTGDCREVPDVSADADPYTGYAVYWNGGWNGFGGTSAAAPLWAALLVLTDASSDCEGNPVGFANPTLYATAADDPGAFHDITSGNNDYTGQNAGTYPAAPGYDMASGLGTPTANLPPALCDDSAPGGLQITSGSSDEVGLDSPASVSVTTSGSVTSTITESGVLPAGMTFADNGNGTATIGGIPSQIGNFPLVLTATNTSSSTTQSFYLSVGTEPAITSADTATFKAGTSGTFSMSASGTPRASFSVAGVLPPGLVLTSTGELAGTPTITSAGVYPVTVTASNGLTPATQSFTVVVDGTPTFTSVSSAPFVVDTAGSFTVTTSAAPVPTLSEAGTIPSGLVFTDNRNGTATISGTPATSGTFTLTIQASNADGSATQSLTLQLLSSVQAPAFTSPDGATFTVDQPGSFQFTATGSPAPTFSIVSGSLPNSTSPPSAAISEMTVTNTGLLSATPYWSTGGSYHIVVEADNGITAPAFQSFTLTVWDMPEVLAGSYGGPFRTAYYPANPQTLGQSAPGQIDEDFADFVLGQPNSVAMRATGYPIPTFSVLGQLPSGTSLVDNGNGTATISGTPTQPGNFVVTVVATNSAGTSLGTVGYSNVLNLSVAPAVAPSFLSPDAGTEYTLTPCSGFNVVASGFPAPQLTETGALPNSAYVSDTTDHQTGYDPSTALIGTSGCNSKTGASGTFPLTFTASSSAGTATQDLALTLMPQKGVGAVFTSPDSATFSTDTYNAFLVQEDSGWTGCALKTTSPLPNGVTLGDWGLLSGVPDAGTEGTYSLKLECIADGQTKGIQKFLLQVTTGTPALTSPSATSFAYGTDNTFTITTEGTPPPALTEAGALPPGTLFVDNGNGTATISGVPTQLGSFPVTVSATTSLGAATQDLDVTVGAVQAPVFTSPSSATISAGDPESFQMVATGTPAPTFSIVSGSLPPGLTLSDTGLISGTATVPGPFPVVVKASNGVSPQATQNFVLDADETPMFTVEPAASSVFYIGGPQPSLSVQVSGYPLPLITADPATPLPPGLTVADTGPTPGSPYLSNATITGTPSELGTFDVGILAFSNLGWQGIGFTVTVDPLPFQITSSSVASFAYDESSTFTITTQGTSIPALTEAGALPPGITFVDNGNGTATVSGIPTELGSFPVTVSATTSLGTATQVLNVSVGPAQAPEFTSASTATISTGEPGSFQVEATGTPTPLFSLVSGSLPPGLTLSGDGLISGIATVPGPYPVVVEASNGISPDATQNLVIDVDESPTFLTAAGSTITYTGGTPVSVPVLASGYPLPTFSATGLPPGLSMVDTGPTPGSPYLSNAIITGTPTELGTFTATILASNSLGTQQATYWIDVDELPLRITTTSLPAASVGVAYYSGISATGGGPPYKWSLSGLPPGLKFSKSTGAISGKPTAGDQGTYTITVVVVDTKTKAKPPTQNTATATLSIAIT